MNTVDHGECQFTLVNWGGSWGSKAHIFFFKDTQFESQLAILMDFSWFSSVSTVEWWVSTYVGYNCLLNSHFKPFLSYLTLRNVFAFGTALFSNPRIILFKPDVWILILCWLCDMNFKESESSYTNLVKVRFVKGWKWKDVFPNLLQYFQCDPNWTFSSGFIREQQTCCHIVAPSTAWV